MFACRADIDAWRNARETAGLPAANGAGRRWPVLAAVTVVALAIAVIATWRRAGPVSQTSPVSRPAVAFDAPRLLDALTREGASTPAVRTTPYPGAMALANNDRELYVASSESGGVVVDTTVMRVTRTFTAQRSTGAIATADGRTVFIGQEAGEILQIDAKTTATRRIHTGGQPRGLALSADGGTLYVAASYAGLFAVDTRTAAIRQLSTLPCPIGLTRSPDGRRLYVNYQCNGPGGSRGHDSIDIVDTATGDSVGTISGLANVGGDIVVSPDGSRVWADGTNACFNEQYDHAGCPPARGGIVNVIRMPDRTRLRALAVPGDERLTAHALRFTPDGSRVAVVSPRFAQVINAATFSIAEAAPLSISGWPVFAADGRTMYTATDPAGIVAAVPIERRPLPPAGLRGRWTADGTVQDVNTLNHGALERDVSFAPGYVGQALRFDYASGSIRIDGASNFVGHGNVPFTIAFRIKRTNTDTGEMPLVEFVGETPGGWRLGMTEDARLSVCFMAKSSPCPSTDSRRAAVGRTSAANQMWHHITLTWDTHLARLYLDGRIEADIAPAFVLPEGLGTLRIRPSSTPCAFVGLIDEIETYDRPLTADAIAALARLR